MGDEVVVINEISYSDVQFDSDIDLLVSGNFAIKGLEIESVSFLEDFKKSYEARALEQGTDHLSNQLAGKLFELLINEKSSLIFNFIFNPLFNILSKSGS